MKIEIRKRFLLSVIINYFVLNLFIKSTRLKAVFYNYFLNAFSPTLNNKRNQKFAVVKCYQR